MLRLRARNIIARRGMGVILIAMIFVITQLVLSFLIEDLAGIDEYYDKIYEAMETVDSTDYEAALEAALEAVEDYEYTLPGIAAIILIVLIYISSYLVSVGYRYQTLSESRGTPRNFRALFFGFDHPIKAVAIQLLILLRIIPAPAVLMIAGILAESYVGAVLGGILEFAAVALYIVLFIYVSLKYSQSLYVFFDHPEYSPAECLKKSAGLMDGGKKGLFRLELSFIPWELLAAVADALTLIPIFDVWLNPYYYISVGNFYADMTLDDLPAAPDGEAGQ